MTAVIKNRFASQLSRPDNYIWLNFVCHPAEATLTEQLESIAFFSADPKQYDSVHFTYCQYEFMVIIITVD